MTETVLFSPRNRVVGSSGNFAIASICTRLLSRPTLPNWRDALKRLRPMPLMSLATVTSKANASSGVITASVHTTSWS